MRAGVALRSLRARHILTGVAMLVLALLAGAASAQDLCKPGRGSGAPDVGRGCIHAEMPPNTEVVTGDGPGIVSALFFGPTTAYPHGALGDAVEADFLLVQPEGAGLCDVVPAGAGRVFEDTAPRLADVTGDGAAEVVVVAADHRQGARLEVWGYASRGCGPGHDIRLIAATPYIGTRHRWLAPAAIADLDGDGHVEIAYVDRPHLTKILRIWRYADGDFREVAAARGFTNHAIGDPFISGGLRTCGAMPEIVLQSSDRTRLRAVTFDGTAIAARDLGPASNRAMARAMACR